eukprot:2668729-Prymnesium_polylepis.2
MACSDDNLCEHIPPEFEFDLDAHLADARAALQSERVASARYRLVPLQLSERQFWRAVFWRLQSANIQLDATGCLSPVPRQRSAEAAQWNAAVWSPTPRAPPGRQPLAARADGLNAAWEGSPCVSSVDCQGGGLYTPRGTAVDGYDEFKG